MISRLKKSAGPTCTLASLMSCHRSGTLGSAPACAAVHRSSLLCTFSIMTIAASTMAPMAIAIPPSDMMLAFTPW